jgi:hypothetical protein
VNEVTLAGHGLSLQAEVGHMREQWVRQRGANWAQEPVAAAKIATRARYANPSWLFGMLWAIAAILAGVVLAIIGLISGADNSPPMSWLLGPDMILILPAVVFTGCTLASVIARRRRDPR